MHRNSLNTIRLDSRLRVCQTNNSKTVRYAALNAGNIFNIIKQLPIPQTPGTIIKIPSGQKRSP
jgi:hypothetical protein